MTSNIDRAADLIMGGIIFNQQGTMGQAVDAIVRALADAGLLAPDLPEPGRHNHRDEPIWETEGATKIMTPGMLPVSLMGPFAQGWDMYPIEARDIAYALLAAADHAEEAGHAQNN